MLLLSLLSMLSLMHLMSLANLMNLISLMSLIGLTTGLWIIYLIVILALYQVIINIMDLVVSLRPWPWRVTRIVTIFMGGSISHFIRRSAIKTIVIGNLVIYLRDCINRRLSKMSSGMDIMLKLIITFIELLISVFILTYLVSIILWRFFIKIWHWFQNKIYFIYI